MRGVAVWETESPGAASVAFAYGLWGNEADKGESAFGSKPSSPAESSPSNPSPTVWDGGCGASWSGGGVGVRGGLGNGVVKGDDMTVGGEEVGDVGDVGRRGVRQRGLAAG